MSVFFSINFFFFHVLSYLNKWGGKKTLRPVLRRRWDQEASQHHPAEHRDRHCCGDEEPSDSAGQQGLHRRQHQLKQLRRNVSIQSGSSAPNPSYRRIRFLFKFLSKLQICLPYYSPGAWEPVQRLPGRPWSGSDCRTTDISNTPHGYDSSSLFPEFNPLYFHPSAEASLQLSVKPLQESISDRCSMPESKYRKKNMLDRMIKD